MSTDYVAEKIRVLIETVLAVERKMSYLIFRDITF